MYINKEKNFSCCFIFTIIASLLTAAGIAAVFFSGLITSVSTLLYFTLILGIIGLLFILFVLFCGGKHQCNCIKDSCLITTSIGSIITSAFALSLTSLATFSITVAILIGAVAFFLISNLIALLNIIVCKLCDNRCDD